MKARDESTFIMHEGDFEFICFKSISMFKSVVSELKLICRFGDSPYRSFKLALKLNEPKDESRFIEIPKSGWLWLSTRQSNLAYMSLILTSKFIAGLPLLKSNFPTFV